MSDQPNSAAVKSSSEPRVATPSQINVELAKYLGQRVVPLFNVIGDRPDPIGSGFVVVSRGLRFLVTAAHVLSDDNWRMPCVWVQQKLIRMFGPRFVLQGQSGDIGLIGLDPNSPALNDFLPIEVPLDDSAQHSDGFPVVVGYPTSRNRANRFTLQVERNLMIAHCEGVRAEKYAELGYSTDGVFLASFNTALSRDLEGNRVVPPQLNGLSGGPMLWFHERVVPIRRPPTLLGVISRKSVKQRLLVGTSVRFLRGSLDAASRKINEELFGLGGA